MRWKLEIFYLTIYNNGCAADCWPTCATPLILNPTVIILHDVCTSDIFLQCHIQSLVFIVNKNTFKNIQDLNCIRQSEELLNLIGPNLGALAPK